MSGIPELRRRQDWRTHLADRLDPQPSPYLGRPVEWARDVLGDFLWSKQREVHEAVMVHSHVAVPSSHATGKSFGAADLAAGWIDTHPLGEAFVVSTAPTWPQVKVVLWRELGRAHRRGKLVGRITENCDWKISLGDGGPAEEVAYGRKPADYDPGAFQGIHARFVLVIIDEACGVPKAIFDAAESIATNKNARILAIGNPDDPSSYFAEVCKPGSGWHVIEIDGLRTPNMTKSALAEHPELRAYMIREGIPPNDEEVPDRLRDLLIDATWAATRLRRWGAASPIFQSKVRGRFPDVTKDTLIHPHWVTLAQARELRALEVDPRMGVDVARYGTDHTIIVVRQGGHCRVVEDIPYGPVTEAAGKAQMHARGRINTPIINVDDHGVGGGVTDILREDKFKVLALNSQARAHELLESGLPRFTNARSEWWWHLRECLAGPSMTGSDGVLDLDPDDDELAAQLTNIKYRVNRHGQIEVESKDEMKKRRVDSPDRGDALVYSLVEDDPEDDEIRQDYMITGDLLSTRW